MSLIIIMGIPAVGKTTLAKRLEAELLARRITFDEWPGAWKSLRSKHNAISDYVQEQFSSSATLNIILDDTMQLRSMRKRYWRLCKQKTIGICFIHVVSPLDEAIRRDSNRDHVTRVGVYSIRRIYESFENLTDEQKPFAVDLQLGDEPHSFEIMRKSCASKKYFKSYPPVRPQIISNQASIIHKANIILNQTIGKYIEQLPRDDEFDSNVQVALKTKREIFCHFKMEPKEKLLERLGFRLLERIENY